MPRRISNAVHRYFNFDESAKFSACKECGNKMKGNHASNLLNHLRLKHETKYQEVLAINENTSRVDKLKPNKNRKDEEKEKKRERLLQCCVKLIAIHGRPFSLLEDNAFKEIKALICADFVEEANCKKIKTLIAEKANTIKEKIITEVAQTLISVKMDSATCMDRQFVGINIQYIKNSKIVVRNLAIKEIFFSQTSENLKCTLREVLADFRIDLYNIFSLTTDNGANYLKISKLLNEEINNDNETGTENDGDEDEDELVNHSDDYAYSLEHFNATFLNDNEQESMVEIRQIACAAHTLQLCIKDVLKNDYENLIEKSRNVVRILRRPLMKLKIKLEKFKKPILDCTTRWFSTYYMLERLKELKTFCDSCNDICEIISENEWIEINHIIISLEPSKEATVRLQAEQLTVGDFFSIWTICKAKTEKINLPLAQDLVVSMTRREKNLLEGKAFLLGIFLDPRLKLILSENERQTAKCYIRGVHQQMLEVEKRAQAITREEEQAATSNSLLSPGCSRDLTSLSNISCDSFQSDLQSLEDILSLTQRVRAPLDTISLDLDYYLSEYLAAPRLAVTESSIEYWSLKSHRLAKLALIALAAPITQTSIANVIANICKEDNSLRFVKTSAIMSGINDVKEVVKVAKNESKFKRQTVLFMDEIHRFNKLQQDTFLPHVENGTIILIGATTENPSFSLNNALLSRCRVIILKKLTVEDILKILEKAVDRCKLGKIVDIVQDDSDVTETSSRCIIEKKSLKWLAEICDGDARVALSALEMAISAINADKARSIIGLDDLKNSIQRTHMLYDRGGEEHYNIVSAIHKSIRASDDNAALYWTTRALHGGEDPLYIARRLVRAACEDIGLGDPNALVEAVACLHGCQHVGMPECDVLLAQCAVRLARSNKNNEVYTAMKRVQRSLKEAKGPLPSVPLHLRNAPTKLMKDLNYGVGYNTQHKSKSGLTYMPEGLEHINFFHEDDKKFTY